MLFGVNLLNTEEIYSYLDEYSQYIRKNKWLNDYTSKYI